MNNKETILICDDDPVVHESLKIYLNNEGFEFISIFNGDDALEELERSNPALVVLDIMMPGKNGLEVCKEIRKTSSIPIIMLTAKGEEIDRILGLELGADDYIVKPFSPREVVARIKAVRRRVVESSEEGKSSTLNFGSLEISIKKYQVKYDGKVIISTPKEVEILYLMASNIGQVFSREQILDRVWGYDFYGDTRTVDTHIRRIRAKLPQEGTNWSLQTVYGVGYKFEVE
ncbi:DNA-binding response regulator, OmpR family, contains REC and winged-helix (wHTH) domain [Dethiosulfatibacter aminovorans DSM 17477]|uniref:DNA-binding response regulator, OmpR family, contains REC and winged-helix (WHTH) domain n=1 Tax=Dethiosulfatibacter aminovorans DSM 17477 TaxID=1121476 RepID=A0A1M6F508_9FIRM|nr:response regulator transcription factor [Dethiosulfatibacter aminovorans]SHI92760.1 DNA-binding response regulator, OmpR family, contains REC and winged-helix (wHTH) domain [Dethiosulfatibacter aminovorans DSM 17477]